MVSWTARAWYPAVPAPAWDLQLGFVSVADHSLATEQAGNDLNAT